MAHMAHGHLQPVQANAHNNDATRLHAEGNLVDALQ